MASKYETHVEPRLDEIKKWSEEGATAKEIAKEIGVSYSGFRSYKEKYPELKAALMANKTATDDIALGSFFKRVTGYDYVEKTKMLNEEGKLVVVKEVTKHIPPDPSAAEFYLINKMPEEWKKKISGDVKVGVEKLEDLL